MPLSSLDKESQDHISMTTYVALTQWFGAGQTTSTRSHQQNVAPVGSEKEVVAAWLTFPVLTYADT